MQGTNAVLYQEIIESTRFFLTLIRPYMLGTTARNKRNNTAPKFSNKSDNLGHFNKVLIRSNKQSKTKFKRQNFIKQPLIYSFASKEIKRHYFVSLSLNVGELKHNIFAGELPVNCGKGLQLVLGVVTLLGVQVDLSKTRTMKN